jgi:hypothetical protein
MKFNARDKAEATLTANIKQKSGLRIGGIFNVKCLDANGDLRWEENIHNIFTDDGLDDLLEIVFSDGAQDSTHYCGLKNAGAVDAADDLTFAGNWSEFTDYTGNRQEWIEPGVVSQAITNSASPAAFPITGSGTVAGAFLCNVNTGSAGILTAAVDFTASRSVSNGDTINVTYTLSAADDGV